MPLSRTTLENQLAKAKSALATRVDQLTAARRINRLLLRLRRPAG